MSVAGLTLPQLSAFDPPVASEGSLDPTGLAAISDRLAERLAPALRARMLRFRFLTAMAVGAMACETLADEMPVDGVSTPAIGFEWLVVEAFVRRLTPQNTPNGVPGSQKARTVISTGQRLSAATYLKGPAVFGFNGVYKPFATEAGVVGSMLEPGPQSTSLVRRWESEQSFEGFADAAPGTQGARLRANIRDEVRSALRDGRCTTSAGSWLFGYIADSLHPGDAGPQERAQLRRLLDDPAHPTRAELARLIDSIDTTDLTEAEILDAVRPHCSFELAAIVDAVVRYEEFAVLVDRAFRTLCAISYSLGTQPLTPTKASQHDVIKHCARELPDSYRVAVDKMQAIGADEGMEARLGEFAIPRSPSELVALLLAHHEAVQAGKPPAGKRPWFEPLRDGWVVRSSYGSAEQPQPRRQFVHPVRVAAIARFLKDTAT